VKNKKDRRMSALTLAPPALQISNQLLEDLRLIYQIRPVLEERGWKMKE